MKDKPVTVLVVDDQFSTLSADLQSRCKEFQFSGVETFDVELVLEKLKVALGTTVLLLDVIDAVNRNPNAGIELYKVLGNEPRWQELRNNMQAVQVVVFTSEPEEQHQFLLAQERRADLSGFVAKSDLYDDGRLSAFKDALRRADSQAQRYRQYPSLADPVRSECELLYSPNSRSMQEVWEKILLAGRCWEPVLIQGETGTGKELVAQAIDKVMKDTKWGSKKPPGVGGKMISYNIGSAPQEGNLQYTELFGAVKGAYSGCDEDRIGVFERASDPRPGRTIFLDEIGDAPHIVQVALLRVLQEKKIIPLGGFATEGTEIERPVNFRLIAASHRDLPNRVEKGEFREDLYYRLNTIEIHVPPLRERLDDIPVLVYHFLEKLNKEFEECGIEVKKVIPPEKEKDIFEKLKSYSWPGNVRQLESFIRRSYVMSLGDEFVLSEDIERLIEGHEPSSRALIEDVRKIKDSLRQDPISLTKLKERHGLPVAKEVARLVIDEEFDGRKPREGDKEEDMLCKQLFGEEANATQCRGWMNSNRIRTGRAKKGGGPPKVKRKREK